MCLNDFEGVFSVNVVIYRARVKDGVFYDMTFNPLVDYEILKKIRKLEELEVITPEIPFETGQAILKTIYGSSIIGRFISSRDFIVERALRKVGIQRIKRYVDIKGTSGDAPSSFEMSHLEEYISGRIVEINKLLGIKDSIEMERGRIINTIQGLYCLRRISVTSCSSGKSGSCSLCKNKGCVVNLAGSGKNGIYLYQADNYNFNRPLQARVRVKKIFDTSIEAEKEVVAFVKSRRGMGLLWCAPGAFQYDVLSESITEVLNRSGRILYITSKYYTFEALEAFRRSISGIKIDITDGFKPNYRNLDISICSYDEYPLFYKCFDYVILDFRYAFIDKNIKSHFGLAKKAVKERGKFLGVTCCPDSLEKEGVDGKFHVITIPMGFVKNPIPEPRIVTSRYLKSQEVIIPQMAVDVIKWSIKEGSRIIIFVPDSFGISNVYNYLTEVEGIDRDKIDISDKDDKISIMGFKRMEFQILISADIMDVTQIIEDVNIIVMHSDDDTFTEEALINIAAMAACHNKNKLREVVFVAAEENEKLSLAKSTIRNINKAAWEKGYLKG